MTLEKEGEAILMLSAHLAGDARGEVGDLAMDELIKKDAANTLKARQQGIINIGDRTELADD